MLKSLANRGGSRIGSGRAWLVGIVAVATLAAPASAAAAPVKASVNAPSALLKIGTSHTATVTVQYKGQPINGKFSYEMIGLGFLKGKVEYKSPKKAFTGGSFKQVFKTPNSAEENLAAKLKIPFVVRFLITTPKGSVQANYPAFVTK